jgi:hypothetical protein
LYFQSSTFQESRDNETVDAEKEEKKRLRENDLDIEKNAWKDCCFQLFFFSFFQFPPPLNVPEILLLMNMLLPWRHGQVVSSPPAMVV